MKHIRTLIERGFLPISTDYRLCPETSLLDGPMTDCCDALKWVNEVLPSLLLLGPTVRPDPTKVVSLGWSSGGQLAMSLGYMALAKGIKPPDAVFALYPPSDMESDRKYNTPTFLYTEKSVLIFGTRLAKAVLPLGCGGGTTARLGHFGRCSRKTGQTLFNITLGYDREANIATHYR